MRRAKKEAMVWEILPHKVYVEWEPIDDLSYNGKRTTAMEFRNYNNPHFPILKSGRGVFTDGIYGNKIYGYYLLSESMKTVAVMVYTQIYIVGKVTKVRKIS